MAMLTLVMVAALLSCLYRHSESFQAKRVRKFSGIGTGARSSLTANKDRLGASDDDVIVTKGIAGAPYGNREYSDSGEKIPSPLHKLVDTNLDRNSVVYEIVLNREMGIDISQGDGFAYVSKVHEKSRAAEMGIKVNDIVVATSATAGDQLWAHDSADSVKSALNTRFVMNPTVVIRFERSLSEIPETLLANLKVPYEFLVKVKRPIGLHVIEGPGKSVLVQYIKPAGGAARSKRIEVGDSVIAMSASWGDRMWEVTSVESFVVGVNMRTSDQLTFKIRRMVPLSEYSGQASVKKLKSVARKENKKVLDRHKSRRGSITAGEAVDATLKRSVNAMIGNSQSIEELNEVWEQQKSLHDESSHCITPIVVNKIMGKALVLEEPRFAADVFEEAFGFSHESPHDDPASSLLEIAESIDDHADTEHMLTSSHGEPTSGDGNNVLRHELDKPLVGRRLRARGKFRSKYASGEGKGLQNFLEPNNYVCTTAAKAYGRLGPHNVDKALALIPWLESKADAAPPDVYFLTSVLYCCAKHKRVRETEKIFWMEIPKRGLVYTVATTNSLMYMYARMGRPDDALKVYELSKRIGLTCTVVTYGVLIKALLRSGKKALQDTSFEILRSLPELNITPSVEVYNQFFEHYAKMHDFRKVKLILRLMSDSKPRTRPNAVSYAHLIHCFAESRKPRSALSIYHQMLKRNIQPSSYTYMGILKALSHMRDGISCVQVLGEMRDRGVTPTNKHYAMAMFACITSNQCILAESVFNMYVKLGYKPDAVLYTLKLRAMLQQDNWTEALELFEAMKNGKTEAQPNFYTYNTLLQFQIINGLYGKAHETLGLILKEKQKQKQKTVKKSKQPTGLSDVFKSLSFGVGHYSKHVQEMQREDKAFEGANTLEALALDTTGRIDSVGVATSTGDGTLSSDAITEKLVAKPSRDSLHFVVSCAESISSSHDGEEGHIKIQGDFYIQTLRAVVMEGHPSLAKRLLEMHDKDMIAFKEDDLIRAKPIEDLARRALINAGAPSNL